MSEYSPSVVEWIMSNHSATLRTRTLGFLVVRPGEVAFDARFITALSQFFARTGRDSEPVLITVKFLKELFLNSSPLSAEIASIAFDVVYEAVAMFSISIDLWEDFFARTEGF